MAVANKNSFAFLKVGTMKKNGHELYTMDNPGGAKLLKKAVDLGDPKAMCNLGQMLLYGDGVPVDRARGIQLRRIAAEEYDIWGAQFRVAHLGLIIDTSLREEGERWMIKLKQQGWVPPPEQQ
jgi:TPR repeat protein